jgi:class 3 adenylate cyclase
MSELPAPVLAYIEEHLKDRFRAAYLGVDRDGRVREWGGPLEEYGIQNPSPGVPATELAPFLEGALPVGEEPFVLPTIQTELDRWVDVHLVPGETHDWVVLLDCTSESSSRQLMQQHGNELSLVRHLHSRILDQFLGKEVAADLAAGILKLREGGERRVITVLFADVRGFTSFSERNPPEIVFPTLNLYLRVMLEPILDQAGMVDKLIGDGVMAVFGLLPGAGPAETRAVRAATTMLEEVHRVNRERLVDNREALEIGVGIATGETVVGILGSKERRAFTAIGHHVNLAARLEGQAGSREILVDEATHVGAAQLGLPFTRVELKLKGMESDITAYRYRGNTA